jgi:hypothetical protein
VNLVITSSIGDRSSEKFEGMNEHQRETEFLRHCISYDESPECQKLDERLTQIQRDERCVRRAVWLMSVLAALAVAGLGYAAILFENFPQDTSHLFIKIISAMGLASIICLVTFAGLSMVYRMKLNQRRGQCRQLVTGLLESRLGQPVATQCRPALRDRAGNRNRETIQLTTAVNSFPDNSESNAQGVNPSLSSGPAAT